MNDQRRIYCRECKDHCEIISFHRDNPILSCGHVKHRTAQDDIVLSTRREIELILLEEATARGVAIEQVRAEFTNGLMDMFNSADEAQTIGHCATCGMITVFEDDRGVRRCGGNLVDNPGCGMPIRSTYHKNMV